MAWLRIDDSFVTHPKVVSLSDKAFRLHVAALCYCARHLTDGVITPAALLTLSHAASITRPSRVHDQLVSAGLWEPVDNCWRIHDWADWNPTADQVRAQRSAAKERMRRIRSGGKSKNSSPEQEPPFARSSPERSPERSRLPSHPPSPNGDGMGKAAAPAPTEGAPPPSPKFRVMTPEEVQEAYRRGFD